MSAAVPEMNINPRASSAMNDPDLRDDIEQLRIEVLRRRFDQDSRRDAGTPHNKIQRNAVLINRAVRRASKRGSAGDSQDVAQAALFAARTYEQLAEGNSRHAPSLLISAAINYQIAGYQANAATLARMAAPIPPFISGEVPSFEELASIFLQRRALRCALSGATNSFELVTDGSISEADVLDAARAVTQHGLAHASRYLLNGQTEAIELARDDLETAYGALAELGAVLESNIVDGLLALIPRLTFASTWNHLSSVLVGNRLWERYLRALGRGFSTENVLSSRSISELWPSQLSALNSDLLGGGSRVLRMPTSAGKTRIAEMVIIHGLAKNSNSAALYIAPFNALTDELATGFNDLFIDLGLTVSSFSGSYEFDDLTAGELNEDLLVVTPEKLDQLMRVDSAFLDRVDTVILDEGHIVAEAVRGIKYELAVSRLRTLRPNATFISLSAVVPDSTMAEFSRWLTASQDPITSNWRPTTLRIARLTVRGDAADLEYPDIRDPSRSLLVPNVVRKQTFEFKNPSTGRMLRRVFPTLNHRAQLSAAMTYSVADQGPVLIYCSQPNFAGAVAKALMDRTEYSLRSGIAVPKAFEEAPRRSALVAEEWLGADHDITRQLRFGIGVHYASMPTAVQRAIEDDFRDRRIAALAATSTLAQGVNFPVRTLVVHSTSRWDDGTDRRVPMLARDFWNIAGRVGRAGAETEGTVVFLTLTSDDRADFARFRQQQDDVEPVQSALTQLLAGLVTRRISSEEAERMLDADLLALLVEEAVGDISESDLKNLLGTTLFDIQSEDFDLGSGLLWREMANTAKAIVTRVPDLAERKIFSTTGLSVSSNLSLREHVNSHQVEMHKYFTGLVSPMEAMELLIDAVASCSEMTPRRDIDASYLDVLRGWLNGEPVADIAQSLDTDPITLTRFIEDLFGYRLPWGISAYLQIAAHQLGYPSIPAHLHSLPLIVKFGVPNQASAWLMALGMPSRRTASLMAASYLRRTTNPTIGGMRSWLSRLDVDQLVTTLGLPQESFESAAKVVLKAHGNDFLKKYYDGAKFAVTNRLSILIRPEIEYLRHQLAAGDVLDVVRDRDAQNRNSCLLSIGGHTLCNLPRRTSDMIALEIDSGTIFQAVVVEITTARPSLIGVKVRIAAHGDL